MPTTAAAVAAAAAAAAAELTTHDGCKPAIDIVPRGPAEWLFQNYLTLVVKTAVSPFMILWLY